MDSSGSVTGRVLVRGSINIDEFFNVPHIVKSGETIASTGYSRRGGGKGANQAVAAAKAGAQVELMGCFGHDGDWLRKELEGYGVGLDLSSLDASLPTGRAIIQLSTSTRDNSIVLLPGANHSSLSLPFPSSSSSSPPFSHLLLQNEIPLASTKLFLSAANDLGLTTMFNPSPMLSSTEIAQFAWKELDWLLGYFAALLAAHPPISSEELRIVLQVAGQAAAMCVEKEGAMESVPSLADVKGRMGARWPEGF
ncbi:hypothetical protein RQP46_011477 [Phenoliferia psychrophenolica]